MRQYLIRPFGDSLQVGGRASTRKWMSSGELSSCPVSPQLGLGRSNLRRWPLLSEPTSDPSIGKPMKLDEVLPVTPQGSPVGRSSINVQRSTSVPGSVQPAIPMHSLNHLKADN